MVKIQIIITFLLFDFVCFSQQIDTTKYKIKVETSEITDKYFTNDPVWLGADGASSIDLGNRKILWLFSDSFIASDSTRSRKKSSIIRNSLAIQDGNDLKHAPVRYYWDKSEKSPQSFFHIPGEFWFWTGHGVMIKDKLIIFLMKEKAVNTGLGFESCGWYAVLISNPNDDPSTWKMKYIEGNETFGSIVGSAAVLKDDKYLYAYGAVEPATHEVYLLRWTLEDAYAGNIATPQWWTDGKWAERKTKDPVPEPLFIGATEYSVHYDATLKKFIQVQSFGFGEAKIGIRMSDRLEGKWSEPLMVYTPPYTGIKKPFMYSAKSHPGMKSDGIYITYNINSFDFAELLENRDIYFPKFIKLVIVSDKKP